MTLKKQDSEIYEERLEHLTSKINKDLRGKGHLNPEVLLLYCNWLIGMTILEIQELLASNHVIIEKLSKDLKKLYPKVANLNKNDLRLMRKFAEDYPHFGINGIPENQLTIDPPKFIRHQVSLDEDSDIDPILNVDNLSYLTWNFHVLLLEKVEDVELRKFYISQCIQHHWAYEELANVLILK